MADKLICYTPSQDVLVDTGQGHIAGLILTSDSATVGACTLYDYAGAGPPTGPKLMDMIVNSSYPIVLFLSDRYSPRFHSGLWLHLSDHCYLTLWWHMPKI
jgi:hypothetical protein